MQPKRHPVNIVHFPQAKECSFNLYAESVPRFSYGIAIIQGWTGPLEFRSSNKIILPSGDQARPIIPKRWTAAYHLLWTLTSIGHRPNLIRTITFFSICDLIAERRPRRLTRIYIGGRIGETRDRLIVRLIE